jgi:hypothetical protein
MVSETLVGLVVVWAICGILESLIWQHKGGTPLSGFWVGFVLGIFGLVYVTLATPQRKVELVAGHPVESGSGYSRRTASRECRTDLPVDSRSVSATTTPTRPSIMNGEKGLIRYGVCIRSRARLKAAKSVLQSMGPVSITYFGGP